MVVEILTGYGRPMTRRARISTLIAASLGFGIVQLDVTVVNVAVHQIGTAFGGGVSELQWTVGAYTLMFAALILSGGALADRFGARRVLLIGFAVFVVSSMACGLAPSMAVLIAARAIQGAGAALLGACSLSLLNHTFPGRHERARALGVWAAGASTALSGGPVVGGVLIATLGWRSIFFINAPIGALGFLLARLDAPETPRVSRGLDPFGQVAAVIALSTFAAALIEAGPHTFTSPLVLAGFALAAVTLPAFVFIELGSSSPMLPLSMFSNQEFASSTLIGLLVNVCFYGLIFVFSLMFQSEHGYSALRAGLAFVPMTAAIMAANLVAGRVANSVGQLRTILVGLAGMTVGCVGLLWVGRSTPYAGMVSQQVLLGGGLGLLVPPMTALLLQSAPPERSGVAAGTLNAMRQTGSLLGIALFGSLIAGRGQFFSGFHAALGISLLVLLMASVLAGVARRRGAVGTCVARTAA